MFKHKTLVYFSSLVWLAVGVFLLSLGLHFLLEVARNPMLAFIPGKFSLVATLAQKIHNFQNTLVCVITAGLVVGYAKGRFLLRKTALRQIIRIQNLPEPCSLRYLFSVGSYILIVGMMGLGMLMKVLPITLDTRGFVDVAVGSALINGAVQYVRILALQKIRGER